MNALIRTALDIDITTAVRAVTDSATAEVGRQTDTLIGIGPLPGTPDWDSEQSSDLPAQRQMAWQLTHLRIELGAGLDPLPTLVNLRRTGATWARIAAAAGTSRQAAHERWGTAVSSILDRYATGNLGGPVADDERDLGS